MNNYSEQIFQSIDTIISQRLNEVSFDKTEICKIISQNKDYPERYWVTNEAGLKYEAYSVDENKKYFEGQKIYVTVPQGNYELRKLIIGTYSADEIPKGLYTNPFSQLVVGKEIAMSGNIIAVSNHSDYDNWEATGTTDKPNYIELDTSQLFPYKNFKDYEYLGFEFAFQTDFNKYQGSYALRIVLYGENSAKLLENNNLIISSKDLYGNPYRLNDTLVFQHLFPWPIVNGKPLDSTLIKKIKLQLIQDNGFYSSQEGDSDSGKDIILSRGILKFGYDADHIKEDKLTIIPKKGQELKYTSGQKSPKTELFLEWVNIDKEANIYSFNSTSSQEEILKHFKDYTVIWLHYVDGIGNSKSQGLSNDIAWNWEVIDNKRNFTKTIKPITFYNNDQYKVVIKYAYKNDETTYYAVSDAIIFENTLAAPAPGSASASGESLRLVLVEGNTGVYNIYGLDGRCVDTSYLGPHTISFEFLDGMTNEWIEENGITWSFPNESTMIDSENSNKTTRSTTYKIKSIYNQGAMNNRIQCQVKLKNGEIRTGSLTLQFGEATTGGTNYSLNLDFVGNATCIHPNGTVDVKIEFAKANGEEVQTPPQFACGWVGENGEIDLSIGNITSLRNSHDISIISYNNQNYTLTLKAECSEVPESNYSILYVTAKDYNIDNGLTVNLTAYLPIPIANEGLHHISGATRIVYSMDAKTYSGSREGYYLYDDDNNPIDETYWSISNDISAEGVPQLRGEITNNKYNSGCSLRPVCYTVDEIPQVCITAYDDNSNALWSQPILIMNNKWQSEAINDWDGSVQINDKDGSIKAPFFIAGKKTPDNSFSGVALGNVESEGFNKTGIYGFEAGNLRYALTDAGSFYVGIGNDNFISFNENRGFNYWDGTYENGSQKIATTTTSGLVIKTSNFYVHAGYLLINSMASINSDKPVIKFSDKFELRANGDAKIGGWDITSVGLSYNDYLVYLGSPIGATINSEYKNTWVFKAGASFGVDSSGYFSSTSGKIGGWLIGQNSLYLNGTDDNGNTIDNTHYLGSGLNGQTINGVSSLSLAFKADSNFGVTTKGAMYAASGKIGNFNFDSDGLYMPWETGKEGKIIVPAIWVNNISRYGEPGEEHPAQPSIKFNDNGTGTLDGTWKYGYYEIATKNDISGLDSNFVTIKYFEECRIGDATQMNTWVNTWYVLKTDYNQAIQHLQNQIDQLK